MSKFQEIMQSTIRAVLLAMLGLLASCTSTNAVIETLDPNTGVTILHGRTPYTLYRDTPRFGANARNFVQLGAISVNRMGAHQYFLWLGIWNTVYLESIDDHREGFDSIVLFADGEPLFLDVAGWTEDAVNASEPIFLKPVATSVDAYYPIAIEQLELLASANEIRLETMATSGRQFELWNSQDPARRDLQGLLDHVSR